MEINNGIDTTMYVEMCKSIIVFKTELNIKTKKLHISDSMSAVANALIANYQQQVIEAKFDKIELITIKERFGKAIAEYSTLLLKLNISEKENKILKDSNNRVVDRLIISNKKFAKIAKEKKDIEDGIQLSLSGIKLTAFTDNVFGRHETMIAKKTKFVKFDFFINGNDLVRKGTYVIRAKLYGDNAVEVRTNDLVIEFLGKEIPAFINVDIVADCKPGRHSAEIFINDKLTYNGSLNLK